MFNDWSRQQGVIAGIFELNDYDYNKPNADLSTHEAFPTPPEHSFVYDYPGGYDDKAVGDRLTKVRQEAERDIRGPLHGRRIRAVAHAWLHDPANFD